MNQDDVRRRAFAMPLTNPAFPPGPIASSNREYLIITYRTDPAKLRELVPEPLEIEERRWSNTSSSACRIRPASATTPRPVQVIPVSLDGRKGGYTHFMFLNDEAPTAGGRELWGFPKKLAQSVAEGRGRYAGRHAGLRAGARSPTGTMGYKHRDARI